MDNGLNRIKQWLYYFIIGLISLVALTFIPMLGSSVGLGWNIPNTTVGWIVWVATKIIVAIINILIFYSFMQQAKLNVKDNECYKEARDILAKQKIKNVFPRSPKKWNVQQYSIKGATIFLTTALATVALTQAILAYDWVNMLTYLFTIIMGLIFGILQMKLAEDYWTDEYYRYALMVKENNEKQIKEEAERNLALAQEDSNKQGNTDIPDNIRSNLLESSDNKLYTWDYSKSVVVDCNNSGYCVLGGTIYPSDATTNSTNTGIESPLEQDKNTTTDPCVS